MTMAWGRQNTFPCGRLKDDVLMARFPHSRPAVLKKWVQKMHRKNWAPSKSSVLCSRHFQEACFDRTGQTARLKSDAVPTKFDFPQHLLKRVQPRKPPPTRHNIEVEQDVNHEISEPGPSWAAGPGVLSPQQVRSSHNLAADHTYTVQKSPRTLKRKIDITVEALDNVKKKLKRSEENARRLKKKVLTAESVIEDLEKKSLVSSQCTDMLRGTLSDVQLDLVLHTLQNKAGKVSREQYSQSLRSFALTL
ncbi:THAP domain-containing protein 2-like [Ornithodoros turicata]|uniref:THAP domain-containing protein 2-like n=1 Tax=Ornithodoros turicata TaxID=34597 RepID=UPI00313A19E8